MACLCQCPSNCQCSCKNKGMYIVLQDFWLDFRVKLHRGQIIHGPVSPRWFELRLIARYNPDKETAELAAKTIVKNADRDCQLSDKDAVVATDAVEVVKKTRKKKKSKEQAFIECPECVLEIPEKSEILLSEIQKNCVDNL